ncbi:MAG TPA: acetyl-coenzyme A synthetase N-terminal domain-containing protein, partial [Rhodopila sp.]|nr:acetyl-coenzyme A synthetase N-terminal domain-containing protein [Rhodopila sp.]
MTTAHAYADAYGNWMRDPDSYWAEEAQGITWTRQWDAVFDPTLGAFGQWFAGGMLNTCYNCLDRHLATGRGDQPALIHD